MSSRATSAWQDPLVEHNDPTDNYLVGNFDGGNQDQLMAVAANGDGWTQLMAFSGSGWDTPWSNDGGGTIDLWYMHPTDKYIAGDSMVMARRIFSRSP